jgi:flagellin
LSVQSGNDTNTAADRQALQSEADQLISEIDRVANQVEYNGQSLLDGTFSSKSFQVGANSGQTLSVSVDSARSTDVGNSFGATSAGATGTNVAMTTATAGANQGTNGFVDSAALAGDEVKVGGANGNTVNVGASDGADDTYSTAGNASSAIAKAAAINKVSSQTGVTAEATNTHWKAEVGSIQGDATNAVFDGDITINDISITFAGGSALVEANDTDQTLADAINAKTAQTGVTADTSSGTLNLNAADGRNINVAISATSASSGTTVTNIGSAAATTTARGGLSFSSNDVSGAFNVTTQSGTTDMVSIGMGNALAGAGGATSLDNVAETSGNEISALQLGSATNAASAVANLDTAIAQVASSRSDIGALLNRLDSASNTPHRVVSMTCVK